MGLPVRESHDAMEDAEDCRKICRRMAGICGFKFMDFVLCEEELCNEYKKIVVRRIYLSDKPLKYHPLPNNIETQFTHKKVKVVRRDMLMKTVE